MIKVVIVEDHPLVVEGLKLTLSGNDHIDVCGVAGTYAQAISLIPQLDPDIVLMDIGLPDVSGVDLCEEVSKRFSRARIIVLTTHHQLYYVHTMFEKGARGYLLKSDSPEEILKAIECVLEGKTYVSVQLEPILCRNDTRKLFLSRREREVLKLISEGYTNVEIAEKLFISPLTVDSHRKNIIAKLGVKNTAEMVSFALKSGFIDDI